MHKQKWIFHQIVTVELDDSDRKHGSICEQRDHHMVTHFLWLEFLFLNHEKIVFKKSLFLRIICKHYFYTKKRVLHDERVIGDLLYVVKKQNKIFFFVLRLIIKKKKRL